MTNHKKVIDVTASHEWNYLSFHKKRHTKIRRSVKMPWHRRSIRVACSYTSAAGRG